MVLFVQVPPYVGWLIDESIFSVVNPQQRLFYSFLGAHLHAAGKVIFPQQLLNL